MHAHRLRWDGTRPRDTYVGQALLSRPQWTPLAAKAPWQPSTGNASGKMYGRQRWATLSLLAAASLAGGGGDSCSCCCCCSMAQHFRLLAAAHRAAATAKKGVHICLASPMVNIERVAGAPADAIR